MKGLIGKILAGIALGAVSLTAVGCSGRLYALDGIETERRSSYMQGQLELRERTGTREAITAPLMEYRFK
jgi:hypothetical protein